MEIAEGLEYVRHNSRAVMATNRRDGTPQMSPVTVAVVADSIVMSTRETAFKVHQLRRDPTAYLCVFPDKWLGRWVQLNCSTEILSLPQSEEVLVEYYRTLRGEHPDWDEYRRAMHDDQRCIVRFTVHHVGPERQG
jgi:PPOX class probable F420-dependent enzyme